MNLVLRMLRWTFNPDLKGPVQMPYFTSESNSNWGRPKLINPSSIDSDAKINSAEIRSMQSKLRIQVSVETYSCKDTCIWFGSSEIRHLNRSRSTAVIPGWAGREERLNRSKLDQLFRIDSDAVLHMNLTHWIRFGSCEVWRLNWA